MIPLINIPIRKKAKIISLKGGNRFLRKLRLLGIKEGKIVKILTVQPFYGPLVIEVERNKIALGREMARRIFVEAIEQNAK